MVVVRTIRLEKEIAEAVTAIGAEQKRSAQYIMNEAIEQYVETYYEEIKFNPE